MVSSDNLIDESELQTLRSDNKSLLIQIQLADEKAQKYKAEKEELQKKLQIITDTINGVTKEIKQSADTQPKTGNHLSLPTHSSAEIASNKSIRMHSAEMENNLSPTQLEPTNPHLVSRRSAMASSSQTLANESQEVRIAPAFPFKRGATNDHDQPKKRRPVTPLKDLKFASPGTFKHGPKVDWSKQNRQPTHEELAKVDGFYSSGSED